MFKLGQSLKLINLLGFQQNSLGFLTLLFCLLFKNAGNILEKDLSEWQAEIITQADKPIKH